VSGFFKKCISSILLLIIRILYGKLNVKEYNKLDIIKTGVIQKIGGINRKVPWPVHSTSFIRAPEKIKRGTKFPGYGMGCYIDGRNGIIIEENVWIGPRVSIISQNHDLLDYHKYIKDKPIIIRKNSLLSANCIILPGVELGEHTVVAAGAVVTKSFPEGDQVLAGVPAEVVKKLNKYASDKKQ
jgi:acetyltransferase-like isoleucine patch superfamily enzyme